MDENMETSKQTLQVESVGASDEGQHIRRVTFISMDDDPDTLDRMWVTIKDEDGKILRLWALISDLADQTAAYQKSVL